jgi:hypothetical protein
MEDNQGQVRELYMNYERIDKDGKKKLVRAAEHFLNIWKSVNEKKQAFGESELEIEKRQPDD